MKRPLMLLLTPAAMMTALLLLPPAAVQADEIKGDLARLQGKWSGKFGPGEGSPITVTFKGNGATVDARTPDGEAIRVKCEVRLDETAKPHKAMDWLKFTADSGDPHPDRQGIYLFEDENTLKTTTAAGDGVRPGSFDGGEAGTLTIVFKREQADGAVKCGEPKAKDDKDAPKGDLGKFQGTWEGKAGPEKSIPVTIAIKGNAVALKFTTPDGNDFNANGELKIDQDAKPHKTVDWVKFTGPNGEPAPENLGLYEFTDANTLRLCSGGPGNPRPTEFKAGEGGPPNLLVLTRRIDAN